MRVGVLELLSDVVSQTMMERLYNAWFKRHLFSITPQAVAAWCRQLGHEVYYATYYGQQRPERLLPEKLDVIFISTFTQASALAYVLAKFYRRRKTLTVIGGPHAKAFADDCLRFFDLVVQDCDKTLIEDILAGCFDRHSIISSGRLLTEVPGVAERLPDILTASFSNGRRALISNVPMLSSIGCPYRCDFCIDWNNPYVLLSREQLAEDLRFVVKHLPGALVSYHDPNFGVKFDQVLEVLETIPENMRNPYATSSSLSLLRGERLQRLQQTRCVYIGPGIESWGDYSNKAGVGNATVGRKKLEMIVEHFNELDGYIPYLGANFIMGTDLDHGAEPFALTEEFIRRLPFTWPMIFIAVPYGGTPLYEQYLAEDRILQAMPFSFYYTPYLVTRLKHYHPVEFYENLIGLFAANCSLPVLARRVAGVRSPQLKALQAFRTVCLKPVLAKLREIHHLLKTDGKFRAFHEGRSQALPEFYRYSFKRKLGAYAQFLSARDMTPELRQALPAASPKLALAESL